MLVYKLFREKARGICEKIKRFSLISPSGNTWIALLVYHTVGSYASRENRARASSAGCDLFREKMNQAAGMKPTA